MWSGKWKPLYLVPSHCPYFWMGKGMTQKSCWKSTSVFVYVGFHNRDWMQSDCDLGLQNRLL